MFALIKQRVNCKPEVKFNSDRTACFISFVSVGTCTVCMCGHAFRGWRVLFYSTCCAWVCVCACLLSLACELCTFIAVTCTSFLMSGLASRFPIHSLPLKACPEVCWYSGSLHLWVEHDLQAHGCRAPGWVQLHEYPLIWHVDDICWHPAETSYYYLCKEIPCDWSWQLTLKCCMTSGPSRPNDEVILKILKINNKSPFGFCSSVSEMFSDNNAVHMQSSRYVLTQSN